jgi:hypothetical protein
LGLRDRSPREEEVVPVELQGAGEVDQEGGAEVVSAVEVAVGGSVAGAVVEVAAEDSVTEAAAGSLPVEGVDPDSPPVAAVGVNPMISLDYENLSSSPLAYEVLLSFVQ